MPLPPKGEGIFREHYWALIGPPLIADDSRLAYILAIMSALQDDFFLYVAQTSPDPIGIEIARAHESRRWR